MKTCRTFSYGVWGLLLAQGAAHGAVPQSGVDGLSTAPRVAVQHEHLQNGGATNSVASLALPFDTHTGIAAFWSGPDFIVLADRRLPALARASGGNGLFASLNVTLLDHATVVQVHLPSHPDLSLTQQKEGWLLSAAPRSAGKVGLTPVPEAGGVRFALAQAGQCLSLPDPASGVRLLVATSRSASGGIMQPVQAIGYTVRPSLEGVVIAADSDQLLLSPTPQGPVLQAIAFNPLPVGLPLPLQNTLGPAAKDRLWLGLSTPDGQPSPQATAAQLKAATDRLAQAPANQKTALALAAARMALTQGDVTAAATLLPPVTPPQGLQEASSSLAPTNAYSIGPDKPENRFVRAAVNLLAGNLGAAQPLSESGWYAWPELHVWQGLYGLYAGQDSQKTTVLLAQGVEQLTHYPTALREHILPQVALAVARYGQPDARQRLDTLPDGSFYDLARAIRQVRDGQNETARVAFENLTASTNTTVAAFAQVALVRLLRETDQIAPDMAVEAYEKLLKQPDKTTMPNGPRQQATLGLAVALAQNNQPRAALAQMQVLKPSLEMPQDILAGAYQQILYRLVFSTLHTQAGQHGFAPQTAEGLSAEEIVQLVAQCLPNVADGEGKAKLLVGYGKLLLNLQKPSEAQKVFEQAILMQPSPLARSEVQDLLAQAALLQGHISAAQRATGQIAFAALESDLAARKAYDSARVAQAQGEPDKALNLLAKDETDAGLDLRGQLYEADHRWAEAVQVVGRLASRALPQSGPLNEPQRILALRLATDAAAAHDKQTLLTLKGWLAGRTLGHERDTLLTLQLQSAGAATASH
ncbi:tetratricopeptide repeat protein [Acetobacter orientalis]|uniref:tetratricopeptide repeat protein n=1 Tax=Acetobacter orientalis TaxID=146474 RepID=UPI000A3B3A39|nr:hypothetical protein [Acetobacter orientalis]